MQKDILVCSGLTFLQKKTILTQRNEVNPYEKAYI